MAGKTAWAAAAVAVVAIAAAWHFTCPSCQAKLRLQLKAAAGDGQAPTVSVNAGPPQGTVPDRWRPHVPARGHKGRHKMYHHPSKCRPNLTAPQQMAYDWRFSPPAEGDL